MIFISILNHCFYLLFMRIGPVFLIGFCILAVCCTNKRKNIKGKECHNIVSMDTSMIVVDSTILLFPSIKISRSEVYTLLDEKPEYPGGMGELIKFIQQSIQYPPVALQKQTQGRVWIGSIIDTTGRMVDPEVVYSVDSLLDEEALRIIRMIPDWKPGKLNGKTVRVKLCFPVTFKISEEEERRNKQVAIVEEKPRQNPKDTGAIEIEYIPPVDATSPVKKKVPVKWEHLIDDTEEVVKASFDRHNNRISREKSEAILIHGTSIFKDKVYISIGSSNCNLIYKGEADFYLEDKQKKLHKIPSKDVDKESVALHLGKGKTAEINVDFPDNCQPGDYLLKIRVYNENEECYYTIHQWFEAYTSRQKSQRRKPIPVSAKYVPVMAEPITEKNKDDIFNLVQNMPEFPGGMLKLVEFIKQNIRYPQTARQSRLEGRITVEIVIDKDGSVIQPGIICSISPTLRGNTAFCEEALRIVSIMPKWKPGNQDGVNLKVRFMFPIGFESPTSQITRNNESMP